MQEVQMARVRGVGQAIWRWVQRPRRGRQGGRRGWSRGQKGAQWKLPSKLRQRLGKKLGGIQARAKRAQALHDRRAALRPVGLHAGAARRHKKTLAKIACLDASEVALLRLREEDERAKRKCEALQEQIRRAPLRDHMRVIPVKDVPLRVS